VIVDSSRPKFHFYKSIMLNYLIYALLIIPPVDSSYITYITTADKISFHYKKNGESIRTITNLVNQDTSIKFAMNGQMFTTGDPEPVGLYVEKGEVIHRLVLLNKPSVNFGLSQAVFYIDKQGKASIIEAIKAKPSDYYYAVELAPLLLQDRKVNPRIKGMSARYTRNGIGILKDGRIVLICSNHKITMEQFANKFNSMGCISAAYIDGAVSECWKKGQPQPDYHGQFAVIVAAH
jgi:uncharacterized protein YigE (DUF2233 family)